VGEQSGFGEGDEMIITNAKVITWGMPNEIKDGFGLMIRDDLIGEIGPSNEISEKYPDEEVLDADGQYVMPGNICAHRYTAQRFSRYFTQALVASRQVAY
jgi:predicted amidohydrolase YtcJ